MTLDGNPIAAFNYDNSGQVRERRQGNGLINRYQYDSLGRLTEHLLREGFEDNPLTLWQQQYGYQSDGELTHISGSNARNYQYDTIGQLISAGDPQAKSDQYHAYHVETFRYDGAGNRISGDGELNQVASGNRLAFFGNRHFEYDRFGNLIAERRGTKHKLLTTYEYDCRHRLIKHVSPNGRVSTYTYDAFNRRTSKTVDGKKTEFIWQGNKLIAECSDKDTVWRSYLYEPGTFRPLALVEGNAKKNQKIRTYWYQNDHLGTPHSLTDSLGELVYSCTYNAYGQLQTETQHQQEARGIRIETNLRFQGQYWDEETGLHYNLNRYYDPGLGRYLTADPIKLAGGLNQYQYCQNPINEIDPLGLKNLPGGQQQGAPQQASNGLPSVDDAAPPKPPMTSEQRRGRIDELAEANAYRRLQEMENATPNAHFLERHGAQTKLEAQLERAMTGANPTTGIIQTNKNGKPIIPPAATRFVSHRDQLNIILRAQLIHRQTGKIGMAQETIQMQKKLGEGFKKSSLEYGEQRSGKVYLDEKTGYPVTAFPEWGK